MQPFSNQAQLLYNGVTTNSNVASGQIIEVLSATKTAVLDSYNGEDYVTYIVNILNSGSAPFTNLTVTDDLGAYTYQPAAGLPLTLYPLTYAADSIKYFVNGTEQTQPTVTAANNLTITGINVPAGGNTTLIYAASANQFTPFAAGSTITNTATISGDGITTPVQASHTITSEAEPYLTIFKSVTPTQVPENGRLTYTLDIQNLGNTATTAADNVQIRDTFLPVLSNITVTYNGAVLDPASYSYDPNTGVFSTNEGVINIPAATYTRDTTTGAITTVPGTAVLTISGNI